jgi:hypothetical protein
MKIYGPPYDLVAIPQSSGIYLVAQAIEKANSFDPDKVAKLIQTAEFTVLGRKIKMGGVSVYGQPPRIIKYPRAVFTIERGNPKMMDITELPADY